MVLLKVFKWTLAALLTSYVITSSKRQTKILGSLSESPMGPYYTLDFYPNGTYLELPQGIMRYWEFGKENGHRVVLIHGISTGASCFEKLVGDLTNSGHRVLIYDLWGRGYSQAPAGLYNEALYTTQLALLLQKVGWEKTNVIGVSLGGGIATSFTAFYPELVNKLVLIAPTGLMTKDDLPFFSKVLKIPFMYEFILNQNYARPLVSAAIQRFASRYHNQVNEQDNELESLIQKFINITFYQLVHHPGYLKAILGTVVDFPFTALKDRYKKVGQQKGISTLIIWGDKDKVVPFKGHEQAVALLPNAKLAVFQGQGHDVLITKWKQVNEEIGQFIG